MSKCMVDACEDGSKARGRCFYHYRIAVKNKEFTVASQHGMHLSRTNTIWKNMRQRCRDTNAANYFRYGGRGIKVCPEWNDKHTGFAAFLEHMGEAPDGMSLDRIDNDGDYEPGNCRWATGIEQMANRGMVSNTGIVGISFIQAHGKYRVTYKSKHVCYADDLETAIKARQAALEK